LKAHRRTPKLRSPYRMAKEMNHDGCTLEH